MCPADPIVSLDEQSLEARECVRVYKPIVAELLEMHHWNLATVREPLTLQANDRTNEWRYAYAAPTNMAYPVAIIPLTGTSYTGWRGQDGDFSTFLGMKLFRVAGGTLYSNIQTPTLEFTSFNLTEGDFTYLFRRVIIFEIAARICMAVTKDKAQTMKLGQMAEGYRQRAIASDMNRNGQTYGNNPTESEIARFGGVTGNDWLGSGYALDPVALVSNTGT